MRRLVLTVIIGVLAFLPVQLLALPLMTETVSSDFFFYQDHHSYMYASSIDFYDDRPDGIWDGVWIGDGNNMESNLSWSHTLPPGLEVPPDTVLGAKLWIDGAYVNTDGNLVDIQGTWDWDPLNHIWFDNTTYDLSSVDEPGFWNMGALDVAVWANEGGLRIDQAIFMMDYTTGATPEPASILLIGLGLLGGMSYRKLRQKR